MSQNGEVDYQIVLRDPRAVLQKQLGPECTLLHFESTSLVKAGDNYGSTILKVKALIRKRPDAPEEELELVAKMQPPTDVQRAIFQSKFTFTKEIFLYEELLPTFASLYQGSFDIAPKFYGSRLSLKPDANEVDEDAVLFMENLKIKGYYMGDRHKGLDKSHLTVAILALAKFHAIGLSIKYKKPSYLTTIAKFAKPLPIQQKMMRPFLEETLVSIQADPEMRPYTKQIEQTGDIEHMDETYFMVLEPTDPWACVVHSDFWINNILFHRDEKTGKVDDAKMVDFQTFFVSSPLVDLVFLICTSMEVNLSCFNELSELYRNAVLEVLEHLECHEAIPLFAKESFEARLKMDATREMYHVLLFTKVVELQEGEELSVSPINKGTIRRLRKTVKLYVEKKWI